VLEAKTTQLIRLSPNQDRKKRGDAFKKEPGKEDANDRESSKTEGFAEFIFDTSIKMSTAKAQCTVATSPAFRADIVDFGGPCMSKSQDEDLQHQIEYLNDVNVALTEAASAQDIVITHQSAEIEELKERISQMERLIEVGADRLHYFQEQRDASLFLLRKAIADGKQLEIASSSLGFPH
jgi:hypothetical protein